MFNRFTITTLFLVHLGFAAIAGAAEQTIHVEWGYIPPSQPAVSGFLLYQEGTPVCYTPNGNATAMDCSVSLVEDTNNFTLTARFTDGSESPHSDPFQYQFNEEPSSPPVLEPSTSQSFTFEWDFTGPEGYTCSGFKIYQNNTLLCETSNPDTRELTCTVESTSSTDDFSITTVYYGKEYPLDTLTYTQDNNTQDNEEPVIADLPITMEIGEVTVSSSWKRIELEESYTNPIVIAGPPTSNSTDPGVIRLRNIDATGFEIKYTEWDYNDGSHGNETVSYLVMEKGHYTINGMNIEAGTFTGKPWLRSTYFQKSFSEVPIVLTTVASINENSTISGRIRNISSSMFQYYFREQEANENKHVDEKINYIACETGSISLGSISLEATRTANAVTHDWKDIYYQKGTTDVPFIFADMQTTDGTDSSSLRIKNASTNSFEVKVQEEQSSDSEVTHPTEVVGTLIFAAD